MELIVNPLTSISLFYFSFLKEREICLNIEHKDLHTLEDILCLFFFFRNDPSMLKLCRLFELFLL